MCWYNRMANCPSKPQIFFQRVNIEDTQKLRFCIRLPTMNPGAMRCLPSESCVEMPKKTDTAHSYVI